MTEQHFNAEAYWATREFKVWVVNLYKRIYINRRRKEISDTKYVRARTKQGAIKTARFHSPLKGTLSVSARLATPTDLGCTRTETAS